MFFSVLYPDREPEQLNRTEPECFRDLHLDQIIDPILKREEKADLAGYFYTPVDRETAVYRQEIFRDLMQPPVRQAFDEFSAEIHILGTGYDRIREDLESGDPWRDTWLAKGHVLDYSERYCLRIRQLQGALQTLELRSAGLQAFQSYLRQIAESEVFRQLAREVGELRSSFSGLQYCMWIKNGTVRVKKYQGEEDLSAQVLDLFARFRQGDAGDYRQELSQEPYAEHVEAEVLRCASRLYPEPFHRLDQFCGRFAGFPDSGLMKAGRQLRFYLGWLDSLEPLHRWGLPFCCPELDPPGQHYFARGFYDMALGQKIQNRTVPNDFFLDPPERIFVITGPNQGGKTTFARAFGQLHYLAGLGLWVPGRQAALPLTDGVLTHFEREEKLTTGSGKLQDDLQRLKSLLDRADRRSVVVINEIFASTTLEDASALGRQMLDRLTALGSVCAVVTFLDELAEHGPETVSLVGEVDPEDPGIRTFRINRRPPDGLAYARTLAGRYGLTYEQLKRRLPE